MRDKDSNRRSFLRNAAAAAAGMALLPAIPDSLKAEARNFASAPINNDPIATRIKFSVIGINHDHIYSQVQAAISGGGELVSLYAKEPDLVAAFVKKYPGVKQAASEQEILNDKSVQLVLSSSIPVERAAIGIRVMKSGKDYMSDKPGITTLDQLAEVRKVQKQTGRIYSIMFSERFGNKATVKAGELVKSGAIGKVIQTINLAPHRISLSTRPAWFFDKDLFGGIMTDIGSHQFDQYLYFTGTTKAEIVASQIGNVHHPKYPKFEDFGDVMLRGNGGTGYIRVDWFTPDGLNTWGDGRLTILGTDGFIEVRKNVDIASHKGGNHLYIVTQKKTEYIDCNNDPLPYGKLLVDDIVNRTETAMPQEHCFYTTELALKAQKQAQKINPTI